jgi:AcrR family transcriptional regulator
MPISLAASRKADHRTLRTQAALRSAFVQLVLSRGYEAVTVGDIIARANVARSTFYLHYSSKIAILKHSLDVPCQGLAACAADDDVPPELVALLKHFIEQRHVNKVFFEDPIRSIWVRHLAELIALKLRAGHGRGALPRSLVAVTIAEMQIALVIHWLKDAGSVRPERIAEAIITNTQALVSLRLGIQNSTHTRNC